MMPEQMSAPEQEDPAVSAAREIAKVISDFRAEVADKVRTDVELDIAKMEEENFDPAAGARGRSPGGPLWAREG